MYRRNRGEVRRSRPKVRWRKHILRVLPSCKRREAIALGSRNMDCFSLRAAR